MYWFLHNPISLGGQERTRGAAASIFTSGEFYQRLAGIGYDYWVDTLYRGVLRRVSDSAGRAYWAGIAQSYGWSTVVNAILGSAEYTNRIYGYVFTGWTPLYAEAYYFNFTVSFEYFWAIRENLRYDLDVSSDYLAWNSDGCSAGSGVYLTHIDDRVCRRHDFGWGNFGNGPTLQRTDEMKAKVDAQFKIDLEFRCNLRWTDSFNRSICRGQAESAYGFVSNVSW